jgi:shikimate dehydrogenase
METAWDQLAYPRLCGLLGARPSKLSQAMHNAGFKALGLPFAYVAFSTNDTVLGIHAMRGLGFRGLSLTIPHKEVAVSLVDDLRDDVKEIRAINTVINYGDELLGCNTDWSGIVKALEEAQFSGKGKSALVFGAGGASRAALYALKNLELANILITNRTAERAKKLAADFAVDFVEAKDVNNALLEKTELFINATPIGLPLAGAEQVYPFDLKVFCTGHTVFDMVTKNTELTSVAQQNGATVVHGARMLLYQALEQFELFTEQPAPLAIFEDAMNAALG